MKAIQIRILPATNFLDARIKAWTEGNNSITIPFQYELSSDELRAKLAATELMIKMDWDKTCKITGVGRLPKGDMVVTIG